MKIRRPLGEFLIYYRSGAVELDLKKFAKSQQFREQVASIKDMRLALMRRTGNG